jgi:hypothetical protein
VRLSQLCSMGLANGSSLKLVWISFTVDSFGRVAPDSVLDQRRNMQCGVLNSSSTKLKGKYRDLKIPHVVCSHLQ